MSKRSITFLCFLTLLTALRANIGFAQEFEEGKNGIRLEISTGYPELTIISNSQRAIYNGFSVQGDLLFPILSKNIFSIDLDFSYRLGSLENNTSDGQQSEWALYQGLGSGLRFNLSYLQAGVDLQFLTGKHLRAGTISEIYTYQFTMANWFAGLHIPLSPVTTMGLSYSQNFQTNVTANNKELDYQNQTIWLKIQIDFGVSFLNLLKVEDSFESTRSDFFYY